ncbi:hypothetical protein [Calycomorphotria hydatis]|uniref:Uncharacterized protein n=1 Tax=Calycomorphotria hydatis TaxID=2528027 RepID=A0A517TEH5_9PLAN|nr:hypothetical protein [Calycomorphotria hydatis]QDT66772.1 hypothetical protein V22_40430 [Calycomorphotria hydatis]
MSIGLDPVVVRQFQRFVWRRRCLLMLRGLSAGLITFLAAIAIIGFCDWYWLLSGNTRWMMSGAAYLLVFVVVWWTSIRRLLNGSARSDVARQLEDVEPELRENLLSAVELATDDPAAIHDSPVFRGLLQGKVAQHMRQLKMPRVLPVRLVIGWVLVALFVAGFGTYLITSGDIRFRQLATRAALPGANIARVSRIQVNILEPTPRSLTLAENETIAVVVEISGGSVHEVTLETFTESQGAVQQKMHGRTDQEFAANIHVGEESVEYRILAGDAVTKRYLIEARPRPHVVAFHKYFRYPQYSGLEDEEITDLNGDLVALEGTNVELKIDVDQEVVKAELQLQTDDTNEVSVIPLAPVPSDDPKRHQLKADIPIVQNGIYKLHLISSETGFENLFSPKYEIRPLPDLIPHAGFVDQQESTLLLPPNDILALKGMAEDDLPLVGLEQQISVNGEDWQTLTLQTVPTEEGAGRKIIADWSWDLQNHDLSPGDQIMTKLVATDRIGNTGESIPLKIVIAAQEFDPDRHQVMTRKFSLYDQLNNFAELLAEHEVSAREVIARLKKPEQSEQERQLDRDTLLNLAKTQREQSNQIIESIQLLEQEMPAGADAYDLELTGYVLARLRHEYSHTPAFLLEASQHAENPKEKDEDLKRLESLFKRTADDAEHVAEFYQRFATHNFIAAIANDFHLIYKQQQLVVNSPTQTWERLIRQEEIVVNQLDYLERLLRLFRSQISDDNEKRVLSLLRWSESQRTQLLAAMESEEKLSQLQQFSRKLLEELEGKQRVDGMDGSLPARIISARKDLLKRAGTLYGPIEQLARAMQQENRITLLATDSSDSSESERLLLKAKRYTAEVDEELKHSIQQLRARQQLTQARPDADVQYAADAGLTHRSVTALLKQHRTETTASSSIPDDLLAVAPAYRTLEAGHYLQLAVQAANLSLQQERWNAQSQESRIDHPRQWELLKAAMDQAASALHAAKVGDEYIHQINNTRWSQPARDADRRISERRWNRDLKVGASYELAEIREKLATLSDNIEPLMEEARAVIAKYVPSVPEMARQLAERIRVMEQETTDLADAVEEQESPETAEKLADLNEEQQQVNEQIEDLFAALVEEANTKDLLDEKQRKEVRDAEAAIATIKPPAQKMNKALSQARNEEEPQAQAKELANAAEQQEKTADALDLVAEHFERIDQNLDLAETREQLQKALPREVLAETSDKQLQQLEQLSEKARKTPEELIKELEKELKQNPAMQQALSEIARDTLKDAKERLELAARDEEHIQRDNENSDKEFLEKKKNLAKDIRKLAEDTSFLAKTLVPEASRRADQGKSKEAEQLLKEAREMLQKTAEKAARAQEHQLLTDLDQLAQETRQGLKAATEKLNQAKQKTNEAKSKKVYDDEKSEQKAKESAEKSRKEFHDKQKRWASDASRKADEAKRKADENVKKAEKEVNKEQQDVKRAQEKLNKNPDDRGLQDQLARQKAELATDEQQRQFAKQNQQRADKSVNQARKEMDEVNRKPGKPLDQPNPYSELADQLAEEAKQKAENLQKQADQIADATNFQQELRPAQNTLAHNQQRQQEVKQDVNDVQEDVGRAARHERRLENLAAAERLKQQADNIGKVADNEVMQAEQKLGKSVDEAKESNSQSDRKNSESLQAQDALEKSEQSIEGQAEQLQVAIESTTAQMNAAEDSGKDNPGESQNQTSPGKAEFTPDELAEARLLAQTLDELDQQQAASQAGESPADNLPQALAQASRQQQAQMAQARQQSQEQAAMSLNPNNAENPSGATEAGPTSEFELLTVNRNENTDWGKLRSKAADDVNTGKSETVSEEYRKSVEAYFKVLAERARKK